MSNEIFERRSQLLRSRSKGSKFKGPKSLVQSPKIFPHPFFACPKKRCPQERAPPAFRVPPQAGFPRRAHDRGVVMNSHIRALKQHNDRILDHAPASAALRWGLKVKSLTAVMPHLVRHPVFLSLRFYVLKSRCSAAERSA